MPVIKIVQPGWTTFTGPLHDVIFTNGVSGNVSQLVFDRIAANFAVEDNAVSGVQAGPSVGIKPSVRAGSDPNRIEAPVAASGVVETRMVATLSTWFGRGSVGNLSGFNSKKIVFWGDSTTSGAAGMFGASAQPTVDGGELGAFCQRPGESLAGTTILNYGNNGSSLAVALADGVTYGISAVIAAAPDVVVMCWLINDVRLGGLGTGATGTAAGKALLVQGVNRIRASLPNCDIVLWGPNSFLSDDPTASGYVSPLGSAQAYTDVLYSAYEACRNLWPNVVVVQKQDVFGRVCQPSSIAGPGNAAGWMADILHPQAFYGQVPSAQQIAGVIGYKPGINTVSAARARATNPSAPWLSYAREVEDPAYYELVATGRWVSQGSTFIDLSWPAARRNEIVGGDLLQLGIGGPVYLLPANASPSAISANTRLLNCVFAGATLLTAPTTINVFRPRFSLDANIEAYSARKADYPVHFRGMITDGGTNYVRIANMPGEPVFQTHQIGASDVVIIPGFAPVTGPSTSAFGTGWQMNITGAFAASIGKVAHFFSPNPVSAIPLNNVGSRFLSGAGTPEAAQVAVVGSIYTRTDGGATTTLYVKESGTGNTGWVAK